MSSSLIVSASLPSGLWTVRYFARVEQVLPPNSSPVTGTRPITAIFVLYEARDRVLQTTWRCHVSERAEGNKAEILETLLAFN